MSADATTSARPVRVLPTGWYVAAVLGLGFVGVLLGASAKSAGRELGGDAGVLAGVMLAAVVLSGVCYAFARYVGNTTAWLMCGVLFGMAVKPVGGELARLAGGSPDGWGPTAAEMAAQLLASAIWMAVIHPRVAGRPNSVPTSWVARS